MKFSTKFVVYDAYVPADSDECSIHATTLTVFKPNTASLSNLYTIYEFSM